ncbi:glycine oxidase ThiO [Candidatus Gottesmanbacteria bacterium]|nr:glycine oxidase ThiO [Candidatus Gottesmanbacteria bacterium]
MIKLTRSQNIQKTKESNFDIIIVGGGIIGCSIALELTERKYKVALIERDKLGSGASSAATGGLTPQSDDFCKGPLRLFALASLEMYPKWLKKLYDITGAYVEYQEYGLLRLAFTKEVLDQLDESAKTWAKEGFSFRKLSRKQILQMEPLLNPELIGGYHLPQEPSIDPQALMDTVARAISLTGCHIFLGRPVVELIQQQKRAKGVILSDGTILSADWVVIAAGAWSGMIKGIPFCPVEPAKGQVLLVKTHRNLFKYHIYSTPGYIIPRLDGRITLGVTYELAGYNKTVTVGGMHEILNATMKLSEAIKDCEILRYWAGLRPRMPDEKPVLGLSSKVERLVFATGHFGLGITLTPITAKLISDLISGKPFNKELSIYSPDRFEK